MAANLFIIEAPGKRKSLFEVLRRAGVRDIDIDATVGHLCANPDGFKPLGIDGQYRETLYRIKREKEHLAASIAAKSSDAKRIFLATDDDQEGDVIARDVLLFCIPEEYRHKAVRLRLKALSLHEVQPFDTLLAAHGDARRVIDRLIGAQSSGAGAVGRVQGSLLLALADQRPVVGVVTHTLAAVDGKGDFVAKVPVFAGQSVPDVLALLDAVGVASTESATMSQGPMNHDQIVLAASLRTGADVSDISRAMQGLYEKGRMGYPRAKDAAITAESLRRLTMVARANGAMFRSDLFTAVRGAAGAHGHEAPNPQVLDVHVNRNFELLTLEEQVLVVVTQNLIDAGIESRVDRPNLAGLPEQAQGLDWSRHNAVDTRLWEQPATVAGMQKWSKEQSLLHFMMKNELGRPSTVISHITKFLTRDLVTQDFDLTRKGREWSANIDSILGHRNLSSEIEKYIENNRKLPSAMVEDMIELFALHTIKTSVDQNTELIAHENDEISSGYVP